MASTTTTIIKFTPLYGVNGETPALCYLLQLDDFRVLLDCGWTPAFDTKLLEPLAKIAPTINAVLISHADIYHLGALPYAFAHLGLDAPVYMTVPVHRMGTMFCYDACQSRVGAEKFTTFTLDDIDAVFDKHVRQLRYNQHVSLHQKSNIIATALRAGHQVGGALWRMTKGDETVVYAVDWNHQKERHLNPGILESITRPSLLITDAYHYYRPPAPTGSAASLDMSKRRNRDEALITAIMTTCRNNGNVLLPVDTAGRALELMIMLDGHWERNKLVAYSLATLSHVSHRVCEFSKSLLEWMSDRIVKTFDETRRNPFDFAHLKTVSNRQALDSLHRPAVILVTEESLETGFGRELFVEFAQGQHNQVIFTGDMHPDTLAYKLTRQHKQTPRSLQVNLKRGIPLSGAELEAFKAERERLKEEEENEKLMQANKVEEEEEKQELKESGVEQADSLLKDAGIDANLSCHPALLSRAKFAMFRPTITSSSSSRAPRAAGGTRAKKTESAATGGDELPFAYGDDHFDGELARLIASAAERAAEGADQELAPMLVERPADLDMQSEIPKTYDETLMQVDIHCQVMSIDLSGRPDRHSVQNILKQVNPRNCVIVHGYSPEATASLAAFCQEKVAEEAVYAPLRDEVLDLTSATNVYQVKLGDQLLSHLDFISVGDFEVAFVEGNVAQQVEDAGAATAGGGGGDGVKQEDKMDVSDTGAAGASGRTADGVVAKNKQAPVAQTADIPFLAPVPSSQLQGHPSVLVGDVKLSDVRLALHRDGYDAEFIDSVLVCGPDGQVQVTKEKTGRLSLHGSLCKEYFAVRSLLYGQFHVF